MLDTPDNPSQSPDSPPHPLGDAALSQAFIGPQYHYYQPRFAALARRWWAINWHWPAFFSTLLWLLYRKMWLYALIYFVLLASVAGADAVSWFVSSRQDTMADTSALVETPAPSAEDILATVLGYMALFLIPPLLAHRLYRGHVGRQISAAKAQINDSNALLTELAQTGGITYIPVLVIVLPLLTVIATRAIPAYSDYRTRSDVFEGIALVRGAQDQVVLFKNLEERFPNSNSEADLAEYIRSKYVKSLVVGNAGVITVTYRDLGKVGEGETIIFVPSPGRFGVNVSWSCTGGTVAAKFRPQECRS